MCCRGPSAGAGGLGGRSPAPHSRRRSRYESSTSRSCRTRRDPARPAGRLGAVRKWAVQREQCLCSRRSSRPDVVPSRRRGRSGNGPVEQDMNEQPGHVTRTVYPKPEHRFSKAKIGTTYRESTADFPPLGAAPPNAPNVVIVLLDDVGYAWPSVYGGLVRMPAAERLARQGLTYCQFHTTGLCAPTRAALLTGRNHHSVSTGVVQEMATGFPGYCGILPRSCATIAQILSPNGYATGWWGKNHNTPDTHTSPAGPFG